jgi:hypothetical protein
VILANLPPGIIRATVDLDSSVDWLQAEAGADGNVVAGDKLKKFSGVAYTGGPMRVGYGWPVVVDLAGLRAGSEQIPFLANHDSQQIVGHGNVEITSRNIRVSGEISGIGAAAMEVQALAARGFKWQLSIGAEPDKMEMIDAGASAVVNGRTVTGPAYVMRSGALREVSFVAIGADGRTSSRVAAQFFGGTKMTFELWLQAKGFDAATLSESQRATLQAAYAAENAPPVEQPVVQAAAPPAPAAAAPANIDQIVASAVSSAVAAIEDRRAAGEVLASFSDQIDATQLASIRSSAEQQRWNRDRVELECRRHARPSVPAIHVRAAGQLDGDTLTLSILRGMGLRMPSVENGFSEAIRAAADAPRFQRMTLHKAMGLLAAQAGVYAPLGDKEGLVQAAFDAERLLTASGTMSTLNLSGILSNVANKAMLAAYAAVGATWNRIAAVRSHSDFKINTLYQMSADGAFKKVGANGELQLSTFRETSYTNKVETYGTVIALTRRDMVNDDLGAFLRVVQEIGRMSALRVEEAVYVALLGLSLIHI